MKQISIIFLLLLVNSLNTISWASNPIQLQYKIVTIQQPDDAMIFTLSSNTSGWISIGFGKSMKNTDMIVARYNKDTPVIEDRFSTGKFIPELDQHQDIEKIIQEQCFRNSTHQQFSFIRKLQTGDLKQDIQIFLNQNITLLYAWGETDNFEKKHQGYIVEKNVKFTKQNEVENNLKTNQEHKQFHRILKQKSQEARFYGCPSDDFTIFNDQCIKQTANCSDSEIIVNNVCQFNDLIEPKNKAYIRKGPFWLYWEYLDDNTVDFMIQYNTTDWFGLGFDYGMKDVYMIAANVLNNNQIYLMALWSEDYDWPLYNNLQQIQLKGYWVVPGKSVVFKFNKAAMYQLNPQSDNGIQRFTLAYSKGQFMKDHGSNCFNFDIQMNPIGEQEALILGYGASMKSILQHQQWLLICWGFISDIALIIIRYFKTYKFYIELHSYIFGVIMIATFYFVIPVLSGNFDSLGTIDDPVVFAHFLMGFLFILSFVVQFTSGYYQRMYIYSNLKFNELYGTICKKIHTYLGLTLYVTGKILILNGKYCQANWQGYPIMPYVQMGVIVVSSVIVIRVIIELIYQKYYNQRIECFQTIQQNNASQLKISKHQQQLIKLLNQGLSYQEIKQQLPGIKYVIMQNRIYSTENILHPGGNFILQSVLGREIDRFLYGGFTLETNTLIKPYDHSSMAYKQLEQNYIGQIDDRKYNFLVKSNQNEEIKSQNQEQQNQYQPLLFQNTLQNAVDKIWTINTIENITQNVGLFNFQQSLINFQNYIRGVEWFGRFFVVSAVSKTGNQQNYKKRLYTVVLCMTNENINLRNQYLDLVNNNFNSSFFSNVKYQRISQTLPMLIKRYEFPNSFSKFIHENDKDQLQFQIEGPFGTGLQLKADSDGTYILIAGGTGLFSFLDLLDFLLKKCIYEIIKKIQGANAAQQFDFLDLGLELSLNNARFVLIASFINQSEFYARDTICTLYRLNKKYDLNFFDCIIRFSDKSFHEDVPCTKQKFNYDFFKENQQIKINESKLIYICGSPIMNSAIIDELKLLNIGEEKICFI